MTSAMKEIGSEFWDVPICDTPNGLFLDETRWFLSGRSALKAIISDIQKTNSHVKTVSLPSWCCDSIIHPFLEADMDVEFYPVLGAEQDLSGVDTDAVLLMDFFGYTGYSQFNDFKGIVIRDVTHSLFSKQYDDSDYYFGSIRKWAGFWTGGYAWGIKNALSQLPQNKEYIHLRREAMEAKNAFMAGKSESKNYLATFEQAEEMLDHCGIEAADGRDCELASKLDVNFIRQRRRHNAAVLLEAFGHLAIFNDFGEHDCPMFIPIMVPDGLRDKLRRFLIDHRIYCPVHWPDSDVHRLTTEEKAIYDSELSLVCDQRYDGNDMQQIIDIIHGFYNTTSC